MRQACGSIGSKRAARCVVLLVLLLLTACDGKPHKSASAPTIQGVASIKTATGPTPTATPTPPFFSTHRIVAYYGNPLTPLMGVLGDGAADQVIAKLQRQAAAYSAIDSGRQVVPALELIESVAQDRPTDNGLYLYRMEPDVIDRYTRMASDNHLLLFLDEQIGRSDPETEVRRLLPRLASPTVQLALDPEFTMTPAQVPGRDLGSMDAEKINRVQEMLEQVAIDNKLPSKILIVHEFQNDMVTHLEQLRSYPHVDLVLDADGFGTRQMKIEKYAGLIANRPAGHAGVKLFYKYDPDLWSPEDVLNLNPPPDVIIYQ
jgi:hypothetical protein